MPPHMRAALGVKPAVDPRWVEIAERILATLHQRFDAGDYSALLPALEILSNAFRFPHWVRDGLAEVLRRYEQYDVTTLDQAFGVERPKKTHLDAARNRETLRPQIIFAVYVRNAKGAPIDGGMFDAVGATLGISGRQASRIFYEPESRAMRKIVRNHLISDMSEID